MAMSLEPRIDSDPLKSWNSGVHAILVNDHLMEPEPDPGRVIYPLGNNGQVLRPSAWAIDQDIRCDSDCGCDSDRDGDSGRDGDGNGDKDGDRLRDRLFRHALFSSSSPSSSAAVTQGAVCCAGSSNGASETDPFVLTTPLYYVKGGVVF